MADAGTKREGILANLETVLGAITAGQDIGGAYAGSDYHLDVNLATRRWRDPADLAIHELPAILITPGPEFRQRGEAGFTDYRSDFEVELTCIMPMSESEELTGEMPKEFERMMEDVHRAVLLDRERSSNAEDTFPERVSALGQFSDTLLAVMVVTLTVTYVATEANA